MRKRVRLGGGRSKVGVERLERRTLLSAAAFDVKNGPLAKVGPALAAVWEQYQAAAATTSFAATTFHPADPLLHVAGDRVAVETYTAGDPAALAAELGGLGATDVQGYANGASALVPFSQLGRLAALPDLAAARPVWYRTNTGSVTSQGDPAARGDVARTTYGYTGAGVKVGVLSDSFDTGPGSYADDQASGDLPGGVQVLQDSAGGTDEGRAMAQLIYDTAPGTSLAFATANGGQTAFANNIKALRNNGAKVIVDDVSYFAEPFFEDGVISQAVDNVVATGVSYFSAAGNEAAQSYESAFRPGLTRAQGSIAGSGFDTFYGGQTHDFDPGPGVDDTQSFTLAAGGSVTLTFQWDQPYGTIPGSAASASDMDIYILDAAGTTVLASSSANNVGAGRDPVEIVPYDNETATTQTYQLMIVRYAGAAPGLMKYVDLDSGNFTEYATNSGTVYGHANAAGAAAVAAAPWFRTPAFGVNPPRVESFSSRGGTPILFSATGARLASAVVRPAPRFAAPDGGNTTFFFSDSASDTDTLPNFFGTSAAAPAAAAAAAVMLQAAPNLSPAQVYATLGNTALDMDNPDTAGFDTGYDVATGFGLIRADAAVGAVVAGSIAGQVFQDNNGNGALDQGEPTLNGVTVYLDTNNNGSPDANEPTAVTTGSGQYLFTGLANGSYVVREVAPAATVATTGTTLSVPAAAGSPAIAQNFGNFATSYAGTGGDDSYVVRLDAATGTKVEILVNGTLLYSAAKSAVPSLAFPLGDGTDTLTVDETNGNPLPAGGITLDAGTGTGDVLAVTGGAGADAFTLSATTLVVGGATLTYSNVEAVTVNGGNGNDTLTLAAAALPPVTFNGGLLATDQDTLNVNAGTFALTADAAATTAHLSIAVGPAGAVAFNATQHLAALTVSGTASTAPAAQVFVGNSLALSAGAYNVTLNGTAAGSQYGQLVVTGAVALGGTLGVSLGFSPAQGNSFTLIDNDGTDAVSGTFAGLAEGAVLTVGGRQFQISYAGGTGNDVTLTVVAPLPGLVAANGSVYRLSGPAGSQTLFVTAGTLTFSADLGASFPGLSVSVTNATVVFNADQHLANVTLTGPAAHMNFGGSPGGGSFSLFSTPVAATTPTPTPTPPVVPLPPTPVPATVRAATADGFVRDGPSAGTNFDADPSLVVKKGPTGYTRETYLTFDLTGIAAVHSATLRLYGRLTNADPKGVQTRLYAAAGGWGGGNLKWNDRPAAGKTATAAATITGTKARWYTWDLTAYLKSKQAAGLATVTLVLKGETVGTAAAVFNSDEAATNRPQLVVT